MGEADEGQISPCSTVFLRIYITISLSLAAFWTATHVGILNGITLAPM